MEGHWDCYAMVPTFEDHGDSADLSMSMAVAVANITIANTNKGSISFIMPVYTSPPVRIKGE